MGDECPYSHSLHEYWLHPSRYKTQLCQVRCPPPLSCVFHAPAGAGNARG